MGILFNFLNNPLTTEDFYCIKVKAKKRYDSKLSGKCEITARHRIIGKSIRCILPNNIILNPDLLNVELLKQLNS